MKYLILLALVFSFGIALADEPIVLGCTNSEALNYNSEANRDDNTCNTGGGGNPLDVYLPLWGMTGSQVMEQFITLQNGERYGDEYCPTWFPGGCYTTILKLGNTQDFITILPGEKYGDETCPIWFPKSGCRVQK